MAGVTVMTALCHDALNLFFSSDLLGVYVVFSFVATHTRMNLMDE